MKQNLWALLISDYSGDLQPEIMIYRNHDTAIAYMKDGRRRTKLTFELYKVHSEFIENMVETNNADVAVIAHGETTARMARILRQGRYES